MTKEEPYAHPGWQWCTSEGAELHTLLLGLLTTFREKVEWLEAAEEVSLRFRAGAHHADLLPHATRHRVLARNETVLQSDAMPAGSPV